MVSRKRAREEAEDAVVPPSNGEKQEEHGLLHQIRNMWEFANLVQYIYSFGKIVKIDDNFDVEDLETECLKPTPSEKLLDIGLCLLKFVSSHRALTVDNFEEYTRRQYNAKAPSRNPFGDEEQPKRFNDLDIFQRLRILQQLSAWTFWNPDRVRERMPEQREVDQTQWRIEELGYDREDRYYYLLDDNRLYRRTDPPLPARRAAKPKANTKKARAAARAAKRRKLSELSPAKDEDDDEQKADANDDAADENTLGGYTWECVAVSLAEYNKFLDSIRRSKDPDEQVLRDRLIEQVLPVIEKAEEAQQNKIRRREKELINLQKMANAKRSSRLAGKQEKERQEQEAAEEARRMEAERIAALKEEEKKRKVEEDRQYRLMTREQRLKDREEKRRRHEEELVRFAEDTKKMENGEGRISQRQLKADLDKRKKDLEAMQAEDQWVFDCSVCGIHGENLDDGTHSVACEKCNVWQHSKCLGIPQGEAEKDDFHFICADCKQRIEDAKKPKLPPLKFRIISSPSHSQDKVSDDQRKSQAQSVSPSAKKVQHPSTSPRVHAGLQPPATNGHRSLPSGPTQQLPPQQPNFGHLGPNGPASPQRQPHQMANGNFHQPPQPSQHAYSPPAPRIGSSPRTQQPPRPQQPLSSQTSTFVHYQPPTAMPGSNVTSFDSQRPPSSHSTQGAFASPIQNRPPMSPTQGNRDVGPLAGFPPSAVSNGSVPVTPFHQRQTYINPSSPHAPAPSSQHSQPPSFTSNTGPSAPNSFSHTPPQSHYSQAPPMSGLSPVKHSPAQQSVPSSTGVSNATILPPIQKLEPSPKLMGRSSADAPIPPPVKLMTPEQEEQRRMEDLHRQRLHFQEQQRQTSLTGNPVPSGMPGQALGSSEQHRPQQHVEVRIQSDHNRQ